MKTLCLHQELFRNVNRSVLYLQELREVLGGVESEVLVVLVMRWTQEGTLARSTGLLLLGLHEALDDRDEFGAQIFYMGPPFVQCLVCNLRVDIEPAAKYAEFT